MSHYRSLMLTSILILVLSACTATSAPPTATVTSTFTATSIPPTATLDAATISAEVRATLPPTFTATFTPSITPTPENTLPPTITPTALPPDEFTLCNSFAFDPGVANGQGITATSSIIISGFLVYEAMQVNFEARHNETGETLSFIHPGGQRIGIVAYGASFPTSGRYDWTVTVSDAERSGLCERGGFFLVDLSELEPLFETATAQANLSSAFDLTAAAAINILETATARAAAPERSSEATAEAEITSEVTSEVTAEATEESQSD